MGETGNEVAGPAEPSPAGRLVVPLDAVGVADLALVGGKAANLGELISAGYPVPGGFVVTTDAHAIAGDAPAPAVGEPVRAAVVEAYGRLGGPVAVRSSATAEDLPGAAFAGQHDTFLNVVGADAVVDAVGRCWASLATERAVAYRRRRGIDAAGARIAVVVQAMVDADTAGVLFTADPVTGARDVLVVEASAGLGEAVVSGLVTPDRYVLDGDGRVREWTPGTRGVVVRSAAGGGVVHDTAAGAAGAHRLPARTLAELARLGTSVAARFARPQDIEWADADGRVWLLQARPLTALPPPPLRLGRIQRLTGPQLLEMLPVRPYPLDTSAWIHPGLGRMVGRMLDEIAGLRVDFAAVLPEDDGVVERFVPPVPQPTWRVLATPVRIARAARRHDPARWTEDPRFGAFQQRVRTLADVDLAVASWQDVCRTVRGALDALDLVTDLRIDYLPRAGLSLLRLRLTLAVLGLLELFPVLIAGAPTRTADANRALADLAGRVRAHERWRTAFADLDTAELVVRVRRDPELADLRAALDRFLAEYGHRETTSPLLVSAPTWSEAPATVVGALQSLVDEPPTPAGPEHASRAVRRLLTHPLVRRTRSAMRVARLVEGARVGIALREDTHFHGMRVVPVLRRALLELGRRLTETGVLTGRDEVFHLRLPELVAVSDPAALSAEDAARLREVVQRRAARREELAGVPLISAAVLFGDAGSDADALVVGTAAGGGTATGPVRVIRTTDEFGLLRSGDVLVCPYTNPAWTSLFQRAAAVVVDTGGQGSHAAIVAREYGIPAVMGTGTGTTALTDGRVVTVDGDRGRVTAAAGDPQPGG